jgi:hypothetical protein
VAVSETHGGGANGVEGRADRPRRSGARSALGLALALAVVAAVGLAVAHERHPFFDSLHRVGVGAFAASFACGLAGVGITFGLWRDVVDGLGVAMPGVAGSRVFFLSQLGKYLPGSVWPLVIQMEAGRAWGASRRTMLAANLLAVVISCSIGLLVACLLLPLHAPGALAHYWWAWLPLPVLVGLLHPRAIPAVIDRAFALVHRPPLGERLDRRSEWHAMGWSLVSWAALGGQLTALITAFGRGSLSMYVLCTAAMALAIPVGVLFVPAPAGAGVREVVLFAVLATALPNGQALAVVVASRVILVLCDLTLAGAAVLVYQRRRRST